MAPNRGPFGSASIQSMKVHTYFPLFRLFSQCSDKYFECFEWRAIDEEFDARNLRAFFGLIILEFLWIVGCLPAELSFQLTYINQKLPLEIVCKSVCFG